mmetsp:Transcript_14315/g.50250  ORF Transcript_14315/g.50250 Transcript_14315/m.50250 type:complete len:402 (-) Transcript_14315:39-1244(-)
MPFFLWVSGASMSISLRVRPGQSHTAVFATAFKRAVRLFVLGLVLQGGWLTQDTEGLKALNLDLSTMRWMGILQRIALVFVITAFVELFVPKLGSESQRRAQTQLAGTLLPRAAGEGSVLAEGAACDRRSFGCELFRTNALGWGVVLCVAAVGTGLTYGVRPPASWPGCAPKVYPCFGDLAGTGVCAEKPSELTSEELHTMACSGPGYLDSQILGVNHVYRKGSDVAEWPPKFGFDPEGFVTTLSAALPMWLGMHVGKVWGLLKDPRSTLVHWAVLGSVLTLVGAVLSVWVPLNKRLWSPSYSLIMSGMATLIYAAFFGLVDATALHPLKFRPVAGLVRTLLTPLEWFQNAVLMDWLGLGSGCGGAYEHCGPALMVYVWIEILAWMAICGVLYRKNMFWKI